MIKPSVCVNPIEATEGLLESTVFGAKHFDDMVQQVNKVMPYSLDYELTNKCAGSCIYCYSSSFAQGEEIIPLKKAQELFDEAWELGVRYIVFSGGDPLVHPQWYEMACYAGEKGIEIQLCSSGLISKKQAKQLYSLKDCIVGTGIHIDTIDPDVYNKVHNDPATLDKKIQGYRNLLEAGYPSDRVFGLLTLSKPVMGSIEQTVDWFVDEMGCKSFCFLVFKEEGYGKENPCTYGLEPGLSEVRKALEYRANKLGKHWLKIGASDAGLLICRTGIHISHKGDVSPCSMARDMAVGNIYRDKLTDIFYQHRDHLLFNFRVKGYCGQECEYRTLCWGCRATAYRYLGDIQASDPKCFLNPEAREYYRERNISG